MKRALVLLAVAACSSSEEAPAGRTSSAIVKGIASDDSQNAAVLVFHYDALAAGGGAAAGCTGTLLAPTLVLTARHCLAETDDGAACDSSGKPISGGKVIKDHDPAKVYVFGGKARPDFLGGKIDPSRGKEILSTGSATLCNADIALVVLDKPVTGATIAPVRLDSGVRSDEVLTAVGWGVSDTENNPKTRQQRTGITVVDIGPKNDLGPAEFRVGEGTCAGDSGGPALSAEGAVVGALSRGGNGKKGNGADVCVGGTNIFTSTAGHVSLIRQGYARVGAEPWLEGQPMPVADAGAPRSPIASTPDDDEDDGCSASPTPRRSSSSPVAAGLFTVAVFFVLGRRRNTVKTRKNTG